MTSGKRLSRISTFSRWELCLLALLSLPNAFVFFAMPFAKHALSERAIAIGPPQNLELFGYCALLAASLAGLLVILGYLFDFARSRGAPVGIRPPSSLLSVLDISLKARKIEATIVSDIIDKISIVPRDVSLGAHVRGILRQRIVVSGGMVPALLNGDERALAILFHEYGHIRNWDKFLPGIVVYSLINCMLLIVLFRTTGLLIALLIYATTSHVCRRREHFADAYAVASLGSEAPLVAIFSVASSLGARTFFHPSLLERASEIDKHFSITRPSAFWICIWIIFLGVAVIGFPMFAAQQSGLFDPPIPAIGIGILFQGFAYDQFSYLVRFTDIAGGLLVLIALTGILVECSKRGFRVFAPPKRGGQTIAADIVKKAVMASPYPKTEDSIPRRGYLGLPQ